VPEVDIVPSAAHGLDPVSVEVLLLVRDGYLDDLEVIAYGDNSVFPLPDPGDLRISEWSEADDIGARHLLNP